MAARAAADPRLPLAVLAGQLTRAARTEDAAGGGAVGAGPDRLDVLANTGDAATSLRQLLSWSYRQLSPSAAAMFTLLGVRCSRPDITVPAAASLAGVPRADAGLVLAELADASLAAEHRPGRYVMHNLVRGYAAEHAWQTLGEAGIRAAVERSLDHYLHTGVIASGPPQAFTRAPPAPGVQPEQLAGEAELENWALAEHQVVLQAIAQAAAAGFITRAWQIFHGQAWFLGDQGYWADFLAATQVVLAAAEVAGNQVALGWTHEIIGRYGTFSGADDEDLAHLARALDHFQRAGDLAGQAWAYLTASLAYGMKGDWAEAIPGSAQALALFQQTGNQAGQGWALSRASGNATLAWGTTTWAAATPGRPWKSPLRPVTLQFRPSRGRRWVSCTRGSARPARRSALTGRPWLSCASGRTRWPAGRWSACWPSSATPAGSAVTCRPPPRPGSRPSRSSATWDGRTSWEFGPGSIGSACPDRRE